MYYKRLWEQLDIHILEADSDLCYTPYSLTNVHQTLSYISTYAVWNWVFKLNNAVSTAYVTVIPVQILCFTFSFSEISIVSGSAAGSVLNFPLKEIAQQTAGRIWLDRVMI